MREVESVDDEELRELIARVRISERSLMNRRLWLGIAIALCVAGVVVLGDALISSFPAPGERGQAHTGLMVIGLAITAAGGLAIGWVTFKVKR